MRYFWVIYLVISCAFRRAFSINCYVCNTTDSQKPFRCDERFEQFGTPDIGIQDCLAVHNAQYCIKHTGLFEGGIGVKRYCSSKDLGNYCEYVKNRGDRQKVRSCIYTCSTDGCNKVSGILPLNYFVLLLFSSMIFFFNT